MEGWFPALFVTVSAMSKIAARDFEDILQCIMPVFEGLLPEPHNSYILDMLFELSTWHALAKLRLHTEHTIQQLETVTKSVGAAVRHFKRTTCEVYDTRELPKEEAARGRRAALLSKKGKGPASQSSTSHRPAESRKGKKKEFSIETSKFHAMYDYVHAIRQFGPADGFSTQSCETEHRRVKKFYPRTNKKNTGKQIARNTMLELKLRRIRQREQEYRSQTNQGTKRTRAETSQDSPETIDPKLHHYISGSTRQWIHLPTWLRENHRDPALKGFLPQLKDHLLSRILGHSFDGDERSYSDKERSSLQFVNDRLYIHRTLRVNYTTYDLRRDQDCINPRTHADVILHAHEESGDEDETPHPYWYARVVKIFHAMVKHRKVGRGGREEWGEPQRMDFLWIRWFGRNGNSPGGFANRRLHTIGFIDNDISGNSPPFGFLDPSVVIRGVHLIPAFDAGRTDGFLGPSMVRPSSDENEDWQEYYVGMFVDRDMFMRHLGGGVGHCRSPGSQVQQGLSMPLAGHLTNEDNDAIPSDSSDEEPPHMEEEGEGDGNVEEVEEGFRSDMEEEIWDYGYIRSDEESSSDEDNTREAEENERDDHEGFAHF